MNPKKFLLLLFLGLSLVAPSLVIAESSLPTLGPVIPISDKRIHGMGDIFTEIKKIPGGASGYQNIVYIDTRQVPYYRAKSSDPYWLQYYMSFWQNGSHASASAPYEYLLNNVSQQIVGFDSPSYVYPPNNSNYPTRKWYDGWTVNPSNMKKAHHFQGKIVGNTTWVPIAAPASGTRYADWKNQYNAFTLNFRIELGTTCANGDRGYIVAGEVASDGWGIVPLSNNPPLPNFFEWLYVIPNGKLIKIHGTSGACPGKTCTFNCINANCSTYCWMDAYHVPHIVDPPLAQGMFDEIVNHSKTPFGGATYFWNPVTLTFDLATGIMPDFSSEGKLYYIDGNTRDANGNPIVVELPIDAARIYAGYTGWVHLNGSMSRVSDAVNGALALSDAKNRPMVMLYMAQDWESYSTSWNNNTRNILTDLANNYSKDFGQDLVVSSHSWSSHIVQAITYNKPNLHHYAFNPAHGDWSYVGGVDWTGQYASHLQQTSGKTTIIAAADDYATRWGGGSARQEGTTIIGSDRVYNADIANSRVNTVWIPATGNRSVEPHFITHLISQGAMNYVALPYRSHYGSQ